jgi:hypothetical protein
MVLRQPDFGRDAPGDHDLGGGNPRVPTCTSVGFPDMRRRAQRGMDGTFRREGMKMSTKAPRSGQSRRKAAHRAVTARREKERVARQRQRHRRLRLGVGVVLVAVGIAVALTVTLAGGGSPGDGGPSGEVMPPSVASGTPDLQPPALAVANTSGISGVMAYDTTGWPSDSHDGPASEALGHTHVSGPVTYSVTPPVGGDHNAVWMNCGVYSEPVPNERAVHNLEHGAVWITYDPSLPPHEVAALRAFEARQQVVDHTGSRYVDVSPYPGLPSPIVISSWGFQLRVDSSSDPRLQRFVNMFRVSSRYTPEYGGPCTGGVGSPLQQ